MKKDAINKEESYGFFGRILSVVNGYFEKPSEVLPAADMENPESLTAEHSDVSLESYAELMKVLVEIDESLSEEDLGKELLQAVSDEDIEKVALLLESGVNPNFSDEMGNTAILEASRQENYEMFKLLLNYDVDLTAKTTGGSGVFTYLKQNDNFVILALLKGMGCMITDSPIHRSGSQFDYYHAENESVKEDEVSISCPK